MQSWVSIAIRDLNSLLKEVFTGMRKIWSIRIVVLVVLLWAGSALAADVKAPAKTAGDNVKADAKAPAAGKENTKVRVLMRKPQPQPRPRSSISTAPLIPN